MRPADRRCALALLFVWPLAALCPAVARADVVSVSLTRAQLEATAPTVSASLPPGSWEGRVARVWLRFDDAPLAPRGGNSWTYTVRFTVRPVDPTGVLGAPRTSALTIFRTSSQELFEALALLDPLPAAGALVDVTAVESVDTTAVPANVRLVLEVEGSASGVAFPAALKPVLAIETGSADTVAAQAVAGAVSYEFEWTYVDARDNPAPADPFAARVPIRVASPVPLLKLDLSYPTGTVHVRMRAVGVHPGPSGIGAGGRPGAWSLALPLGITANGPRRPLEPGKNWHLLSTYAAGADVVSSVNFYDGALRHRQGQKRITSESSRLVTETKYDAEGRPAINFLQAPAGGAAYQFEPLFNAVTTATGTAPYDTSAFDGRVPPAAANTSGAGRYYSSNVAVVARQDGYVPDAEGYPFNASEYTRDGSGRIRRSGGYGRALAIGGYNDAAFLYGSASSSSLRMMFGSDIGHAEFYDRNLQLDPNRVATIAYVDPDGKVIASALTGDQPPNLASVAPPPSTPMTFRLDENNAVDVQAGRSRSASRIVNDAAPADLFFEYDLNGVDYAVDPGDPRFPPLCATCRYRLRVRITAPNGKPVDLNVGSTRANDASCSCPIVNGVRSCTDTVPEIDTTLANPSPPACTPGDWTRTFTAPSVRFCAKLTDVGEYEVVKELTIVDGAIDTLVTTASATPGYLTAELFEPPATTPAAQCGPTCTAYCQEATRANPSQFSTCLQECQNPQTWAIPEAVGQSCTALQEQIANDLAPGGILEGQSSHPEQCHVAVCGQLESSNVYDSLMTAEDSYTDALCAGYFDPLGGVPGAPALPAGCTPQRDPFFATAGVAQAAWMRSAMQNYTTNMPGFPAPNTPNLPPQLQNRSMWQVAEDPEFDGVNLLTGDAYWRMFRTLYNGAKQIAVARHTESPTGANCPYWNDERAHVKRPHSFASADAALAEAAEATGEYCGRLCPVRVDQWLHELDQTCGVIPASLRKQVAQVLLDYCRGACGVGNPLAVLTTTALGNDPALQKLRTLLPKCDLGEIAVEDPYETQTICNTTCCTGQLPGECAAILVKILGETLPSPSGSKRSMLEGTGAVFRRTCADWVTAISAEGDRVVLWSEDGKRQCSIILVDQSGNRLPPAAVRVVSGALVAPLPAGLPATRYTGIAIEVEVEGASGRAYLYSDCDIEWLTGGRSCTIPPPVCPATPDDPRKPGARVDAKSCLDDVKMDRTRIPWRPLPRRVASGGTAVVPVAGGTPAVGTPAVTVTVPTGTPTPTVPVGTPPTGQPPAVVTITPTGREFLPVPDPKRGLACRPCLQELLAQLVPATRGETDSSKRGTCFDKVRVEKGEWVAVARDAKGRECRVRIYAASGKPFDPKQVVELAGEIAAPAPVSLGSTDPGGLAYAGVSVQVRTASGWLVGYVYSDCPLPTSPDCESCGIALDIDPCLLDVFDWTNPNEPRRKTQEAWRCATAIDGTQTRVVLVRPVNGRDQTCYVVFVTANGTELPLNTLLGIVGAPRVTPSPRGPRHSGQFDYAGIAVTVRVSTPKGPVEVEVFVYSNCGFIVKEDCTTVVVDWPIDWPPAGDSTQVCVASVADLADQQGAIALDKAQAEFEVFVTETHHNRCFTGVTESFRYTAVPREYHYTLHYYDQAKNLVQTVPPAGVRPLVPADVATLEAGGTVSDPAHGLTTRFRYNSLNQVIRHETPDTGWRRFWYDSANQLRFSRSAQQAADGKHAYMKYDARGRVVETGLASGLADTVIDTSMDDQDFPGSQQTLEQIVRTVYDTPSTSECKVLAARNLRGRIAAIRAQSPAGDVVTCYSYDPHGNITSLLQVLPGLNSKRLDYEYDVVDGKVLAMRYQVGLPDAFHHRYQYDADRRLVAVETSRDGVLWERDASYAYYRHGPLSRVVLGQDAVQGIDHLYGITGWPKGLNADTLTPERDPGGDGAAGANAAVARDAFATAVHYYPLDYTPAGAAARTPTGAPQAAAATGTPAAPTLSALAQAACVNPNPAGCGLYDGSVTELSVALSDLAGSPSILGRSYKYDQLYRLLDAKSFSDIDAGANRWPATSTDPNTWRTELEYDPNGNITRLRRYARTASGVSPPSTWMDRLSYRYETDAQGRLSANRLLHINDSEPAATFASDLDDQGAFNLANPSSYNYAYDANGRLVRDRAAGLNAIAWNAADRLSQVQRTTETLDFVYDGLGRRVAKITKPSPTPSTWTFQYFIRDEKGEIRATYTRAANAPATGVLEEHTIVGAGRVGVAKAPPPTLQVATPPGVTATLPRYSRVRGAKQYELANHTGNIYATISDRKIPAGTGTAVTHYEPDVVNALDYDPFGSLLPERQDESAPYRFGFSGLERDDELKGQGNSYYTHERFYDPRVGRWLSPDPVEDASVSPYVGFSNNPLRYSDPKGRLSWDEVKDTASNVGQTFADMGKDLGKMGVGIVEGRIESLKKAKDAYNKGQLTEAAGWAVGINGTLESLAEKTVEWENAGASREEIVGLAVGELSGMNRFMEGVTGETLDAEALTTAERWERGITGAAQVINTAGSVANGVSALTKPRGVGVKPPAPKGCSFTPDTLVLTLDGLVPISEIRAGDFVWSRDERTGALAAKPVAHVITTAHETLLALWFVAEGGGEHVILSTPNHPFYVKGEGWVPADSLDANDRVLGREEQWLVFAGAAEHDIPIEAFNLDVADFETFFVGELEAWVHNSTFCDLHHTIPREVRKSRSSGKSMLPKKLMDDPDIVGKPGNPNRWPVPRNKHQKVHHPGKGKPGFNERWEQELDKLAIKKPNKQTWKKEDILKIRDKLTKEFGIEKYRPK